MILSHVDILDAIRRGAISVSPFLEDNLQPASLDLTLDDKFRIYDVHVPIIDPREEQQLTREVVAKDGQPFYIYPGQFLLASTRERVGFGPGHVGRLEGKSSLGRRGLVVHATAGFFDPGFRGYPTLEMYNLAPVPIALYPGMRICQMSFLALLTRAHMLYGDDRLGSHYQNQPRGPQEAR